MTASNRRDRPIRIALLGGGPGSFIGAVHHMAALLDSRFDLVAGVFSRDRDRTLEQGRRWGVADDRIHTGHGQLFAAEALRADGIEAIAIATPNDSHFAIAAAALKAGLHVICDKPMTATIGEARELVSIVGQTGLGFALTYTYTGYPMIREARDRIAQGAIGAVRKVVVEYPQGWLANAIEGENTQASWRTDPARAGAGGCIGDIGVHAFQLMEHVSGLRATELCADLSRVVSGRLLDDDCNILLRLEGDVPAVLIASQICTGERNGLRLRIYGETGGIDWCHDSPGELRILHADDRVETFHAGGGWLGRRAAAAARLPAGHPEGFIEAFANIYRDFADAILSGEVANGALIGVDEGLRSMMFVDRAIVSNAARNWVGFDGEGA